MSCKTTLFHTVRYLESCAVFDLLKELDDSFDVFECSKTPLKTDMVVFEKRISNVLFIDKQVFATVLPESRFIA